LQQKLIVTLSYSIRIYKLRTLGLLHTIQLPDFKLTKTPVFAVESHPLFDTFILLSADNQLKLFDLNTEKMVKSYTARFNTTQVRWFNYSVYEASLALAARISMPIHLNYE
jgi:WD40 repeat protein